MQNTFGISSTQAANSLQNYQTFNAGSGIKDADLSANVQHRFSEHLALVGSVGYTQLLGDAADSPIVKDQGSDQQFATMVGLIYNW